jgi:cardiolipin synthase
MPNEFLISHWLSLHGSMVVLGLIVYVVTSHARQQRRHPSAALAWVVSLTLMPYLALPLYLLIGNRKVYRRRNVAAASAAPLKAGQSNAAASRYLHLTAAMGLPQPSSYQQLDIHKDGGDALQALRSVILEARSSLDVCTFLLGRDALGEEITRLLIGRAQGGVRVRLLIDGIGMYLGGRPDLKRLRAAGVDVAVFISPFQSHLPGRTNLRNHRKMAIADGTRIWTGGRNLAAEYFVGEPGKKRKKKPWIDLSFDLRGDICRQAQAQFNQDWKFATQAARPVPPPHPVAAPGPGTTGVQLVPSGPDQADDTLYSLLISACFTAQKRIRLVTPYFVPDSTLLMALTLAARRGIAVDLVLPNKSNHRLADLARPAALRDMSAAGAHVWLNPVMIHAKAMIIDDDLALAGTANLDERSLFLNYELMFAFYEPADVRRFAQWIDEHRANSVLFHGRPPGILREFGEGLIRWLAFQL